MPPRESSRPHGNGGRKLSACRAQCGRDRLKVGEHVAGRLEQFTLAALEIEKPLAQKQRRLVSRNSMRR
jgi:hypothetical protein